MVHLTRLLYSVNITFICTEKLKKKKICVTHFTGIFALIEVIWNQTCSISKVACDFSGTAESLINKETNNLLNM